MIDVAHESESGGCLRIAEEKYGFANVEVLFAMNFSPLESAWGETSDWHRLERSAFEDMGRPEPTRGVLTDLFHSYAVGFSKNVFRVLPETAIELITTSRGYKGFDFYASNERVRLLVEKTVLQKERREEIKKKKSKNFLIERGEVHRNRFLDLNLKYMAYLQNVQKIFVFVLSKAHYDPPTSVPVGRLLCGIWNGYRPSIERQVEEYNVDFRGKIIDSVLEILKSRNDLYSHLELGISDLCPNCGLEIECKPALIQPCDDPLGNRRLSEDQKFWVRRSISLDDFYSKRVLGGVSFWCEGCDASAYYEWEEPVKGIGILLEGQRVTNSGWGITDIFSHICRRAFPMIEW